MSETRNHHYETTEGVLPFSTVTVISSAVPKQNGFDSDPSTVLEHPALNRTVRLAKRKETNKPGIVVEQPVLQNKDPVSENDAATLSYSTPDTTV
jgi:hypothetical protein